MIFVDTSVWIRAFRSRSSLEATHLEHLLDRDEAALTIVTRLEILIGATERNREALRLGVSALPFYEADGATWRLLERWVDESAGAGERFGVADLLIAAIARGHDGELWTLDEDFARMSDLGFVTLHVPTLDS